MRTPWKWDVIEAIESGQGLQANEVGTTCDAISNAHARAKKRGAQRVSPALRAILSETKFNAVLLNSLPKPSAFVTSPESPSTHVLYQLAKETRTVPRANSL